ADVASGELAGALGLADSERAAIARVFADPAAVTAVAHSVPYNRVHAALTLDAVFDAPPFSTMLVPYHPSHQEAEVALQQMGPDLVPAIAGKSGSDALEVIVRYYQSKGDPRAAFAYLTA